MSGGSFNYVCFKLGPEDGSEAIQALPDLRKMEQTLRAIGKVEAANEISEGIKQIESARKQLETVGTHLFEMVHDVEWWFSGDIGEEDFDETCRKLYDIQEKE